MEAFHYLFHPVTRRLRQLLGEGELGELRHVETVTNIPAPPAEDPRWSLSLAGGALMDLGCFVRRPKGSWAKGDVVGSMRLIDDCYCAAGLAPRTRWVG